MEKAGLFELNAVVQVAAHGGFRAAAIELGVAPSTLSHAITHLEARIGVRLFNRTTRSVVLSEAGAQFIARVRPALEEIRQAMEQANDLRDSPTGTLRINTSEGAAREILTPIVISFLRRYPDMHVDLVTEGRLVDIVGDGFDVGFRLAEAVPQDMVSIPFGPDVSQVVVCAPSWLQGRVAPQVPEDLLAHRCIRQRLPRGALRGWEFERHGLELRIDVSGPLTLDNHHLMIEAALQGVGIAYVYEGYARDHIAAGRLLQLLPEWTPSYRGLCLYYPSHRHVTAGLRAFIEQVKQARPPRLLP